MAQTKTQPDSRTTFLDSTLVDLINNGLIILDDTLKIHAYNKWMQIQTNKQEESVLSKKITEIFPNINTKVLQRKIKTTLLMQNATYYTASTSGYLIPIKINQIQNSKFEYMQQDVSIVPYDVENKKVALIITDQTGMANTNALLRENILKVKKLNEALIKEKELTQKQHEQLIVSSRNAAMGEMISMIAHQWRQPLSVINTSIASLKIKKELGIFDENSTDVSLKRIEKIVLYLSDTINDFRDYFKPNKNKTVINLAEIFAKAFDILKTEFESENITYTQSIDTDITITAYKNDFIQVILNLLKNSLDAFRENDATQKFLNVSAAFKNEKLIVDITDNAGGIKEAVLKKIFEPYYSTKSKNGTGLGLYISQKIIEEHLHGTIEILSKDNQTFVTISLPK